MNEITAKLKSKAEWVKRETLKIHKIAPETRIASSLSCIEFLVTLYYGGFLKYKSTDTQWNNRDRFIVSKGHGSISLYPILADLEYFPLDELKRVGAKGSFLGGIPDPIIPGYETVNGSLGHGIGVGCGVALSLNLKAIDSSVFVLVGDGELYEGSNWEAIMFAAHHNLKNLIMIVDNNKKCMLDYCENVVNITPLSDRIRSFGWNVHDVDGHDVEKLYDLFQNIRDGKTDKPTAVILDTIKGHGVPALEKSSLCHVISLKPEEIDELLKETEPV